MPSGRRRERPEPERPTFFIDRSVGRRDVPNTLLLAGLNVVLMHELYPNGADQWIGDDEWIEHVSALGYVALTKDSTILRSHRGALERSTLRLFAIDSSRLTGPEMAERVSLHLNRVLRRAWKPGPYLYVIHAHSIELRWRGDGI